jgi:hypothetical protein
LHRPAVANLEAGDRLARVSDDRLLARDRCHIADRTVHHFLVTHGFSHTHIEGDLGQPRHFHDVAVAELFLQLRHHGLVVVIL